MPRERFVGLLKRVKDMRDRIARFDEKPPPHHLIDEPTTFAEVMREFVS